jgi:hypothetical protein
MTEGDTMRWPWLAAAASVGAFAMGTVLGMVLTAEIGIALYVGATLLIWALCLTGLAAGRIAHRREMAAIEAIDVELYDHMDKIAAARRDDGRVAQ